MALSGKGKEKKDDSYKGKKVVPDKGKNSVVDKGKKVVRDDDEEEEYKNDEYIIDEAEEDESDSSSGEDIKVTRKKRHKKVKERFELDEDDYDLLEEANVTGFCRPPNLGGKFKRLKRAGYASGRKDSGIVAEDISEEEETEGDEEDIIDYEEDEEEVDDDGLLLKKKYKSQKKGGRQTQRTNGRSRQRFQNMYRDSRSSPEERRRVSKPSPGERRRQVRDALADLNEGDDSDDNGGNDQDTLARILLEKQFEPSSLEVHYITRRDDRLRQTDIPERLQVLEEAADALPSSDLKLRQAAEWIFDRAFGDLCVPSRSEFQHLLNIEKAEIVRQIANILHLVHNEKLEIPFIGLYRREECLDLLKEPTEEFSSEDGPMVQQYKALWAVQEWNKKWLLLQRRKSKLQVSFNDRVPADSSDIPEKDKLLKVFRSLEDADSEHAVDACEAQFNLHFPISESDVVDSGFKRPKFRSLYRIGHEAGLGSITKHFGLEAFGDNVKAGFKINDILDEAFLPDDVAASFLTANTLKTEFRDPASVIRGARHQLAMEISTEPSVRQYVRTFYAKNATVNTRPTTVGIDAIDAFHQFEGVKWISDKLINTFDNEQWLLIQKAEEEKLIDVTVGLSKENIDSLLFECEQLSSSDGSSPTSQHWNEQRKQILQEAIVTLLLPTMEKEVRMNLVTTAKQVLVAKCGLQLWNKVSVAPYDPAKAANNESRTEGGSTLRVLACCWGPPSTGTTFVMLDADGEILNVMHTGYLNIKAFSPEQAQRKENDQARLLQVVIDHKPHIVVVGAAKVQCRYLSQDISEVLFKVVEQHAGDLAEGLDTIKLVYGDESISSLFEASKISQKQLPGRSGVVRRAVALGRFLQNPVAMVASLCGSAMEVLSIKLHPLQSLLGNEELYDVIERVMVTITNQVGIDINLAVMHDWLFETLQFVAGLGPRKAEVIRRAIQTEGRVLTRNDLYLNIRGMDKKIFMNSAGFIRVRQIGQTSSEVHQQEPLDNTRIHPEGYQMAKNLAEAVIEKEARRNNEEVDDDNLKMAVEHVMKNPHLLDTVDIEEYAQSVQVVGEQSKRIQTLELIKSELQRGFQERRKLYSEPSREESFYLITGESEETFFPGRIVQATVRKVQEHQVMCVLESGLLGFIQKEDLSDDCDFEPKDKVSEGSSLICRVKEVNMDKFLVDLTCKESDLRGGLWGDMHHRDKHFKPDATCLLSEQEKICKKKENNTKKTFKTRPIVHPKFQNLSTDDAIKALTEKDVGDFIIHPSCKGPAHLSITLKLSDGLFSHIDIAEGAKENWDLTSFLRLGKTLTIGDESYTNLDEVVSKYVSQLVIHLHAILLFRKYRQGTKSEIADALRSEKAEKPKSIPYCFSIAHEYPGAFMLSYMKATILLHEYISLVPSGFRFRKKVFDTIDKLNVHFQSHFHDPIPEASNRTTNWGERGRGRGGRGRGDRGRGRGDRGRGRGDRGRGRSGRGRGDSSWDKGGENDRSGRDNSPYSKSDWGNDTSTTNSNRRGYDWNSGGGNSKWGDDRGNTSDSKGEDSWNDPDNGGGGAAWGDKGGIASNTEGEASGWKEATNASGGGGGWDSWNNPADGGGGAATNAASGGGWDSWNDPADGGGGAATNAASEGGGAATNAASGGGGWDSWNDPADGGEVAATNEAGGGGPAWGDISGIASNTEGGVNISKATNAAGGGGGWDTGKGDSDKAKGDNVTKIAGSDGAWDCATKSTGGGDGGWGSVPASGGGWDAVEVGHDDVSGNRSGGPDNCNDNAGGVGERTKRWGSNLCPSSPAKRPAHNSWKGRETTSAVDGDGDNQDGRKPACRTTDDAWGSVANSAGGGGDGWENVPESKSGGWDVVQAGDKGGFNSHDNVDNWNQTGREGSSNRRDPDQAVAGRQERYSSWGSDPPPAAPSNIPVKSSWGDQSEPPASTADGWGQPAELVKSDWGDQSEPPASTADGWGQPAEPVKSGWGDQSEPPASTADGWGQRAEPVKSGWGNQSEPPASTADGWGQPAEPVKSGWGDQSEPPASTADGWGQRAEPVKSGWGDQSEPPASTADGWGQPAEKGLDATVISGASGWDTVPDNKVADSADPWDAVVGTEGWGKQEEAAGNDGGWNSRPSQRSYGQDEDRGRGRWGNLGGRGSQNDDGRWESRGGRGFQNDDGRWEDRRGRGSQNDHGRWEGRGGRGSQNNSGRWEGRGGRGSQNFGGLWEGRGGRGSQNDSGRWGSRGGRASRSDGGGSSGWD